MTLPIPTQGGTGEPVPGQAHPAEGMGWPQTGPRGHRLLEPRGSQSQASSQQGYRD